MSATPTRHIVPGSERTVMPGATVLGDVAPDERFEVTVRLRAKPSSRGLGDGGAHEDRLPAQRQYLSREDYAAGHGADPQDIAKVTAFAAAHQLAVVEETCNDGRWHARFLCRSSSLA
jgi:kumamolisin